MITFTKAYTANGKTYATLREAQVAAIEKVVSDALHPPGGAVHLTSTVAAEAIVDAADEVVCALTTTDRSKPRARKVNGGSKPRKPKTSDVAPQFKLAAATE